MKVIAVISSGLGIGLLFNASTDALVGNWKAAAASCLLALALLALALIIRFVLTWVFEK